MDFHRRVAVVCVSIPFGRVATYGQIAMLCGRPRGARQVGHTLARAALPEDLPAHRVVNSKGVLSGAAAFDYECSQQMLLEGEGVTVTDGPRVDLKRFGWRTGIEELETFERLFQEEGI